MRIVVNDIAATPDAGGVYSILSDLYNQVRENDKDNEWIFILAGEYFQETDNIKIIEKPDLKKNKLKKFIFELFNGYKFINSYKPDIYISLQNIATLKVKATRQIVYLHQPIPFQIQKNFSFLKPSEVKLAFYQHVIGRVIKYSISRVQPHVIVQTKWMERAVHQKTKLPKEKLTVEHPFVNIEINDEKHVKRKCNSFFYPASGYLYKNHNLVYEAIDILNRNGINNFNVKFTLNNSKNHERKNIQFLGHIKRSRVFSMYENNVLIFPSYIESFGLPLVEAALKADIILAADTEFSRELLRNYDNVYYYSYDNPKKLAKLMAKVIKGEIISNGIPLSMNDNGQSLLTTIENVINKG